MKVCPICDKGPVKGNSIVKRGMAKKKGGIGRRNVRVNKRRFLPNLQPVRTLIDGTPLRIMVCTSCIRSGKVERKPRRVLTPATAA